jgi:murein DD-endopeptidase MepM/ murein hydrolase activator NlpD
MLSNSKYVESLAKYDQSIVDSLKNDKDGYLQDKQEIQNRKKEVQAKKTELSNKKAEVDALVKESKTQLAKIEAQQKALEAEQKKIDLEMDKARKQLDNIISQANNDKTTNDKITYDQSNFLWPTPGYYRITSPYGMRNGRLHKGVDIGAPTGAKIVSAKAGVVYTKAYDSGGYGNYVIVNHGGGYMTVYAHMSSVSVSKGQEVAKGQKIGEVGSTGRSTGPHLHFEIRKDGTAGNPMNYY